MVPLNAAKRSCFIGWAVLLLASTSLAQDLTLKVTGVNPRFRSHAPIPLELRLNWNSSKIIEGTLRLKITESSSLIMTYENPDIALGFGDLVQRIVLPPIRTENGSIEVTATFKSDEWGSYDLGVFPINLPAEWRRQFLIGMVTPTGDQAVKGVYEYLDKVSLDRYRPNKKGGNAAVSDSEDLDVINVRISARDVPTRAAPMCAYDVIVLAADSLQDLRPVQQTALLNWVDAGGSLLVDASGSIRDRERDFLNELAGRVPGENEFLADSNDRLVSQEPIVFARRGFGRVAVSQLSASKFSDKQAMAVTCWVWKVRSSAREVIAGQGKWADLTAQKVSRSIDMAEKGYTTQNEEGVSAYDITIPPYAPHPLRSGDTLKKSLLPSSLRVVPLPVVMLVLLLFLLVIAPGDWFVLGKLNKRMLTWVAFPAACLFFTGVMVVLANVYVGKADYHTTMRFADWGSADRLSRIIDVETRFTSSARPIETDLSNQLFSTVNTTGVTNWQQSSAPGGGRMYGTNEWLDETRPRITLVGRPTTQFTVTFPVRKWTPTVSRFTSFAPEVDETLSVDWDSIDTDAVFTDAEALVDRLRAANPGAGVAVLCADKSTKPRLLDARTEVFLQVAIEGSARQPQGLFTVVSALSPNGHESLEDVVALDKSNPDEALVLVVFGAENDVIVHRRLFHRNENEVEVVR